MLNSLAATQNYFCISGPLTLRMHLAAAGAELRTRWSSPYIQQESAFKTFPTLRLCMKTHQEEIRNEWHGDCLICPWLLALFNGEFWRQLMSRDFSAFASDI